MSSSHLTLLRAQVSHRTKTEGAPWIGPRSGERLRLVPADPAGDAS
jgi:hypothetical protein